MDKDAMACEVDRQEAALVVTAVATGVYAPGEQRGRPGRAGRALRAA